MSIPEVPLDVVDLIFQELPQRACVKACSLVCRDWRKLSLAYIYNHIILNPSDFRPASMIKAQLEYARSYHAILDLLETYPYIAPSIRKLTLVPTPNGNRNNPMPSPSVSDAIANIVFFALKNLDTVYIDSTNVVTLEFSGRLVFNWTYVDKKYLGIIHTFERQMWAVSHLPTVRDLHLENIDGEFSSLLGPSVEHLTLVTSLRPTKRHHFGFPRPSDVVTSEVRPLRSLTLSNELYMGFNPRFLGMLAKPPRLLGQLHTLNLVDSSLGMRKIKQLAARLKTVHIPTLKHIQIGLLDAFVKDSSLDHILDLSSYKSIHLIVASQWFSFPYIAGVIKLCATAQPERVLSSLRVEFRFTEVALSSQPGYREFILALSSMADTVESVTLEFSSSWPKTDDFIQNLTEEVQSALGILHERGILTVLVFHRVASTKTHHRLLVRQAL